MGAFSFIRHAEKIKLHNLSKLCNNSFTREMPWGTRTRKDPQMTKTELVEAILNCNHKISSLRISIAENRAKGSDWAEDSRLQLIAELEYAIHLFSKDLEKVGA